MDDSRHNEDGDRLIDTSGQYSNISKDELRKIRTDRFISEMLSMLAGETSYESAMDRMLAEMATILKPDRLSIFECGGSQTENTFELCAEGVKPLLGEVHPLPSKILKHWFRAANGAPVVLVPDVNPVKAYSEPLYIWCVENNVTHFMAAPFFNEGEIVGFLGAYNYRLDEDFDIQRLFATVSTFIGARLENRRLIDNLAWAVRHDALTRLLNRRGYEQSSSEYLAQNPDEPYTLALIDLDDFKKANDLYGHLAGDAALQAFGQMMLNTFPENALLSRNGGDEFLALIPGKNTPAVDELIEQFAANGVEYEHDGKAHRLTMSIGYACFPEHASDYEGLHSKADTALYSVKLANKCGARKYSPELDLQYRTRLGFSPHDIAEHITCGIVIHSADEAGTPLFLNDELLSISDCNEAPELQNYSNNIIWNLLHPDDYNRVKNKLISQAERDDFDTIPSGDFHVLTRMGKTKHVLGSCRLVDIDEVGKVYYTILIELDH